MFWPRISIFMKSLPSEKCRMWQYNPHFMHFMQLFYMIMLDYSAQSIINIAHRNWGKVTYVLYFHYLAGSEMLLNIRRGYPVISTLCLITLHWHWASVIRPQRSLVRLSNTYRQRDIPQSCLTHWASPSKARTGLYTQSWSPGYLRK